MTKTKSRNPPKSLNHNEIKLLTSSSFVRRCQRANLKKGPLMTLSPEIRAHLKPVILGMLTDIPGIIKDSPNEETTISKVYAKFQERLLASEITREDLVFFVCPMLVNVFTKTLDNIDDIISDTSPGKDNPNAN